MGLCDDVREHCAAVAARARFVEMDLTRASAVRPGPAATLDFEHHHLDGPPQEVAAYVLTLDTVNFGSGWFPTLRKRPGLSGYQTVARALADRFRLSGAWSSDELRALGPRDLARTLGQDPRHELMALYARALNDLGRFLAGRSALAAVAAAGESAERLAEQLAAGMPLFDDRGFYKRAQIVPNDLTLAGIVRFADIDRLTIFPDNVVPHVLRVDGVLRYDPGLAARIDAGELIDPGSPEELEIRACAVHACELIAARLGVAPRTLDTWLWNRGRAPRYKALPRHRSRSVFY